MNSNVGISTVRRVGDTFIHVTISTNNYASDGQTLKVSEQAAACERFMAGLPGDVVPDSYGSPGNQVGPPDIAPPPAGAVVDAELELTEVPTPAAV